MPNYQFLCEDCGPLDLLLSFSEVGEYAKCPDCGLDARRVYSMPGVLSTSGSQKKARLLNEQGAEPKVIQSPATGNVSQRTTRVGGRPWQINH